MIKKLAQSLREYKKPTILTLIFITGEVFFEVLIPFFTADLVNAIKAFSGSRQEAAGLHDVVKQGLLLVAMALASLGCRLRRRGHLREGLLRLREEPAARYVCAHTELLI